MCPAWGYQNQVGFVVCVLCLTFLCRLFWKSSLLLIRRKSEFAGMFNIRSVECLVSNTWVPRSNITLKMTQNCTSCGTLLAWWNLNFYNLLWNHVLRRICPPFTSVGMFFQSAMLRYSGLGDRCIKSKFGRVSRSLLYCMYAVVCVLYLLFQWDPVALFWTN